MVRYLVEMVFLHKVGLRHIVTADHRVSNGHWSIQRIHYSTATTNIIFGCKFLNLIFEHQHILFIVYIVQFEIHFIAKKNVV